MFLTFSDSISTDISNSSPLRTEEGIEILAIESSVSTVHDATARAAAHSRNVANIFFISLLLFIVPTTQKKGASRH